MNFAVIVAAVFVAAANLFAATLRSYSIVTSTAALLVAFYSLIVAGKANRTANAAARREIDAIESEGLAGGDTPTLP